MTSGGGAEQRTPPSRIYIYFTQEWPCHMGHTGEKISFIGIFFLPFFVLIPLTISKDGQEKAWRREAQKLHRKISTSITVAAQSYSPSGNQEFGSLITSRTQKHFLWNCRDSNERGTKTTENVAGAESGLTLYPEATGGGVWVGSCSP